MDQATTACRVSLSFGGRLVVRRTDGFGFGRAAVLGLLLVEDHGAGNRLDPP